MKRKKLVTLFIAIILITGFTNAQTGCKVLVPGLEGRYSGDCKSGLADGMGEAVGEDYYKGEFVKGLPDGEGTYLWKNGATYTGEWKKGMRHGKGRYEFSYQDRDSILVGDWKNDKYMGRKVPPPYIIEYRTGIGRVSCMKVGNRPYVKYKFSRGGAEAYSSISNLMMQSTSGSERTSPEFTGYEQVEFPFWGKLTFNAPNAWYTAILSCELRLTINEPAAWIVTISY